MSIKNILITGSRAPATLFLIRKLKRAGYNVFIAESCNHFISKYSNCVTKKYKITAPNSNFEQFIKDIIEIIKKEKIDLIIPTCEEIFHISKGKYDLEKYCKVFCDNHEKLIELHNKWTFYNKIKTSNHSVKLPQSWYVENKNDLEKIIQKNKKYILKPIYSRFSTKTKILYDIPDKFEEGKYILQQFIEGEQFCSYSIIKNNNLLMHSDYKTEYSANGGATIAFCYGENEKIKKFVDEFSKNEDFEGQIAFDFIQNDSGLYLIECNPRLTSGIQLFEDEKVISNAFCKNEKMETFYPNRETKSVLFLAMIIYCIFNIKNKGLINWLKTFLSSKDVIFDKNDLKPFFMQGFVIIMMLIIALKNKINLKEISTYDIEWNGNG